MSSGIQMNVKLARDVIGRSTLRLKGKPCSGGNGENYINARNRKVYTMIELHGVGLLAEGQSTSRWRFEFFLSVTRERERHIHIAAAFFLHLVETTGFLAGFIWRTEPHCTREKETLKRYSAFGESICCCFRRVDVRPNKFPAYFSLSHRRMRG